MAFQAGQKLSAAIMNSAVPLGESESAVNRTFGTTTSTSYTASLSGTGQVTLAFVAPASGKIVVYFTATGVPSVQNYFCIISVGISGAAGTIAASDDWQAYNKTTDASNDEDSTFYRSHMFTGLTPGAAGTITMYHKVIGGSGNFSDRQLSWRPVGA